MSTATSLDHFKDTPIAVVDVTSDTSAHAAKLHKLLRNVAETNHLGLLSKEPFVSSTMTVTTSSSQRTNPVGFRHFGINE